MKRLTRNYIEGIAERVLTAYRNLPEIKGTQLYRIDPEILLTKVLGLNIEYAHLSLDRSILGLTSFGEVEVEATEKPLWWKKICRWTLKCVVVATLQRCTKEAIRYLKCCFLLNMELEQKPRICISIQPIQKERNPFRIGKNGKRTHLALLFFCRKI